MKKITYIPLLVLCMLGIFTVGRMRHRQTMVMDTHYTHKLVVGNQIIFADVAKTSAQMQQGLSNRAAMQDNQGMLFDYGTAAPQVPTYWMKDMKFDLDFIWIRYGTVAGLTESVAAPKSASETLLLYPSPVPVDQVLEVNAGWAKRHKIKIGDAIKVE